MNSNVSFPLIAGAVLCYTLCGCHTPYYGASSPYGPGVIYPTGVMPQYPGAAPGGTYLQPPVGAPLNGSGNWTPSTGQPTPLPDSGGNSSPGFDNGSSGNPVPNYPGTSGGFNNSPSGGGSGNPYFDESDFPSSQYAPSARQPNMFQSNSNATQMPVAQAKAEPQPVPASQAAKNIELTSASDPFEAPVELDSFEQSASFDTPASTKTVQSQPAQTTAQADLFSFDDMVPSAPAGNTPQQQPAKTNQVTFDAVNFRWFIGTIRQNPQTQTYEMVFSHDPQAPFQGVLPISHTPQLDGVNPESRVKIEGELVPLNFGQEVFRVERVTRL